jgi:hypothetical protein
MSEFLFLFRGSQRLARSPAEMQISMQKWVAWFRELNEKGAVKDPGNPLDAPSNLSSAHALTGSNLQPALAPEAPLDAAALLGDASDMTEPLLKRWRPRDESEAEAIVDHGEPS